MCKVSTFVVAAAFLIIFAVFSVTVCASVSVGVKQGDWIEYNVKVLIAEQEGTNVSVSSDHNITWAKMEITQVQGTQIGLNIQTMYSNGTITPADIILNLEAGILGDAFIIPANLNVGDTFFDKHQGNITITDFALNTVAGVQRNVISTATSETKYTWDQATGVLLSAQTTLTDYTMTTTINKTNLWASTETSSETSPAPISGLFSDFIVLYSAIAGIAIITVVIGAIFMIRRKSANKSKP